MQGVAWRGVCGARLPSADGTVDTPSAASAAPSTLLLTLVFRACSDCRRASMPTFDEPESSSCPTLVRLVVWLPSPQLLWTHATGRRSASGSRARLADRRSAAVAQT